MPTTTTGVATTFIDFTRASNATVTDSDGKVKWAPHNLLLASESFDAASWSKSSVTPTANSIAAPNGTTTADTLAASGANGTTLQTFTAEAISYTFAVWLKRKTGTGNIQIAADSGTYTTVTITSDWALYTVTQTPAAGSKSAGIRIVTSADEVYAWGASLYRSDLAMQPNTSAYPMYNPTTPKNLIGYTEDFTNAQWAKGNLAAFGSGSVSNAIVAPNGLQIADKIVASNTASAYRYIAPTYTAATGPYVISVYAKLAEYSLLRFADLSSGRFYASFDLSNGTVVAGSTGGAGFVSAGTPVAVGNGWYRCSIVATFSSSSITFVGYPSGATLDAYGAQYAGDGTSGIYLWGAQLSDSASLDPYVPVYGAAVTSAAYYGPRRDFDPVTLACKGLLVEEARTNIILHSNDFSQSAWAKAGGGLGTVPTITSGQADPWGGSTAWRLQANSGGTGVSDYSIIRQTIATNTSPRSLWIKSNTGSNQSIYVGAVAVASVVTATPTWTRVSLTPSTTSTFFDVGTYPGVTTNSTQSIDVLIWGAQCELAGAASVTFNTSYIPTGSASATRNADVASVSTQAFPYSSTAGSFVLSFLAGTANGLIGDGSAASTILYSFGQQVRSYNGSTMLSAGNNWTSNAVSKAAVAFDASGRSLVVNAGTAATDALAFQSVTRMDLGYTGLTGGYLNGHIRQITYLPRRISNTELQQRTSA